ncbi:MAG: tetratricopeptide repeat protein [Candidatus Thorarchaeota archaeon]
MTGKTHKDLERAETLFEKGEFKRALEVVQLLGVSSEITKDDGLSCTLLESRIRMKLGDAEIAYTLIDGSLNEFEEYVNPLDFVEYLIVKAEACWRSGRFDVGLESVEDGQEIVLKISGEMDESEIKRKMSSLFRHGGIIHWYKGDFEHATELHNKCLELCHELDDKKGVADCLNNLGLVYWSQGDLDKAAEYYEQSLNMREKLEDKYQISVVLNNLGNVSAMRGDIQRALEYHSRSLEIKKELGNKRDIALSLTNLGAVYESQGALDSALEHYHLSLELYEELAIKHEIALTYNNLASAYHLVGDLDLALDYLKRSLVIRQQLGNQQDIAQSLGNLGEIYRVKGESEQALETYQESYAIYEEAGNDLFTAIVLFQLVCITLENEKSLLSEDYLKKLQQINERTDNRIIDQRYRIAHALSHKAKKRVRDKLEAQGILEQVVSEDVLDHSVTITALIHLCELLLVELKMTEEEDVLREVKDLTERILRIAEEQTSYSLLVEAYLLQSKLALIELDIERAMILLTKAEDIAQEKGLLLLARRVGHEHDSLVVQMQKWESIVDQNPTKREMIDLTLVEGLIGKMIKKTVATLDDDEKRRLAEVAPRKKYELVYTDFLKDSPETERSNFRVGIAQIGLSEKGDIVHELYEEKDTGLFGIREEKIDSMWSTVRRMVEDAHKNDVNILLFPELIIDLNYKQVMDGLIKLANEYGMYIVPGSFHDEETKQNLCRIIGPSGVLWEQEKHIPATILYAGTRIKERIQVETESRRVVVANTEFGRIAIVICRDFLDMDLRVELKNSEPPVDLVINPAFTPVTADFRAAHFDARRSIYAYCFFANAAEFGDSLIYSPEKERAERTIPPREEGLIYKDVDLFQLRSERTRWEAARKKQMSFIQSTR